MASSSARAAARARHLGQRAREVDHVAQRGPARRCARRGAGARAGSRRRRTGWPPARGSSAARARCRARSARARAARAASLQAQAPAAHLPRVPLEEGVGQRAGCRRAAGAAGGISTGKTERRKKRSSRNCLAATASLQVAVGGGHHPHVHAQGLHAAHALELLLLDEAQDLALQRQGQVADLVEEERAVVGHLRLAHLARRWRR